MPRISIRDLPDHIHQAMVLSANHNHRSLEGEIRHALEQYVLPSSPSEITVSSRAAWQIEAGKRLGKLFERLREDDFLSWKAPADTAHIAKLLGEDSPDKLFDYLDGIEPLTFKFLDKLKKWSSFNDSWILNGKNTMFAVENIGSTYIDFIVPSEDRSIVYNFIRIIGGRSDGTILVIKENTKEGTYSYGWIHTNFLLSKDMGGGGQANLKHFLQYLKRNCAKTVLSSYTYEERETDTYPGEHHPVWWMKKIDRSEWLRDLFRGEDPHGWVGGETSLAEIRDTAFGTN